jgi:RNA-directed DNA polymerase
VDKAKPFGITKREVWEAYKRVKANQGAAGVDGQSIEEFEEDLSNNLYRIWNRMSSGSYFPPPVRRVDIPKGEGRTRPLGVPTVSDRIAQMVVKRYLEPILEPVFHGLIRRIQIQPDHITQLLDKEGIGRQSAQPPARHRSNAAYPGASRHTTR